MSIGLTCKLQHRIGQQINPDIVYLMCGSRNLQLIEGSILQIDKLREEQGLSKVTESYTLAPYFQVGVKLLLGVIRRSTRFFQVLVYIDWAAVAMMTSPLGSSPAQAARNDPSFTLN